MYSVRRHKGAAFAQACVGFLLFGAVIFFGVPKAIDGIMESRINSEGGCYSATYDTASMWKALITAEIGGCKMEKDVYHNAWILRNQTLALAIAMVICLPIASFLIYKEGPFGAEDIFGAIAAAVVGFGVLAVAAIALLIYLAIYAMAIMLFVGVGMMLWVYAESR